jgi:hypothetical protein
LKYIVIEMGSDVMFQRELLVEISWGPYLVTRVRVTPNLILEVAEIDTAYVNINPLKSCGYFIYH